MALPIKLDTSCSNITAISEADYCVGDITIINNNFTNLDTAISSVEVSALAWNDTYTNIATNSGRWESVYDTVNGLSATWESLYTTVTASSGTWGTGTPISLIAYELSATSRNLSDTTDFVTYWLDSNFPASNYSIGQLAYVYVGRIEEESQEDLQSNLFDTGYPGLCPKLTIIGLGTCESWRSAQGAAGPAGCNGLYPARLVPPLNVLYTGQRCVNIASYYFDQLTPGLLNPCASTWCHYLSTQFCQLSTHDKHLSTTPSEGSGFFGFEYEVTGSATWQYNNVIPTTTPIQYQGS